MTRNPLALVLAAATAFGGAVSPSIAVAQTTKSTSAGEAALSDPEPWRFNAALYGWAMSVSSTMTVHNQTLDTNASFIDLLQKSQSVIGFMGYFEANKGRVGVYQVMPITDDMRQLIMRNGNAYDIAEQAKKEGVRDLRQSGLLKVKQGVMSLEEVEAITNE